MSINNINFPKYIVRDGQVGVFHHLDFGMFPVYSFGGSYSLADNYELKNGSDNPGDLDPGRK